MRRQPDFNRLWCEYFAGPPRKVTYEVRQGPNGHHDLVFLDSLVHEARFTCRRMRLRGKHLTIPIERDCWEMGMDRDDGSCELYVAKARLTISPVLAIEWKFQHRTDFSPDEELWIGNLSLLERSAFSPSPCNELRWNPENGTAEEKALLTIDGYSWQCLLAVNEDDLKFRLQDLEVPYLYSQRYPKPKAKSRKR